MMKELVEPIRKSFVPQNPDEDRALSLLKEWDGRCDEGSFGASLAVLSWRPYWFTLIADGREVARDPHESFRLAVRHLREHFGRVEVALGELQRLRHDGLDLPMGGGPDIMNAFHGYEDPDGRLRGVAGDSFVLIVEFWPEGPRGFGIMNFGSNNRAGSAHYSDQALLFARRQLRRTRYSEADLQSGVEASYRAGERPRWSGR
jgi:acyl-homoserine-lactone acylase